MNVSRRGFLASVLITAVGLLHEQLPKVLAVEEEALPIAADGYWTGHKASCYGQYLTRETLQELVEKMDQYGRSTVDGVHHYYFTAGSSAAERSPWEREVAGSSPARLTIIHGDSL